MIAKLDSKIQIFLPEQFIVLPDFLKDVKYPSKNAPDYIITSLDRICLGWSELKPDVYHKNEI